MIFGFHIVNLVYKIKEIYNDFKFFIFSLNHDFNQNHDARIVIRVFIFLNRDGHKIAIPSRKWTTQVKIVHIMTT